MKRPAMKSGGQRMLALVIFFSTFSATAASGGLQFDGVNDYVTFGQKLGVSQLTAEVWFMRTGAGVTTSTGSGGLTAVPLMAKGRSQADGSNVDMNWFLGITSSGVLGADFEEGAGGTTPGLNHSITGTTPLALNTWYHAAVTYDGNKWQLFLDGALEAELVVGEPLRSDSIQHASLGSALDSAGNPSGYFAGVLDEARVWNYARTAAQIADNRFTPIVSAAGLIGRWALDETSGTTATDSSGFGVHGTLMNGPVWKTSTTITLLAPPDQGVVPGPNVMFTCQAQDEKGLASATLYIGRPPQVLSFSGPAQTEDTYIEDANPDANFGSASSANVDGATPHAHGLIRFPNLVGTGPGQVPSGTTIASAILRINCSNNGALMKAYRMTMDWAENTATWNQASTGVPWPLPGADATSCHAEQAYDADCTATGWRSIDLTAIVQEWVNGAENYGILLTDTGTDGVDFYTSESGTPPELIITLQPAQPLEAVETQTLSGTNATATFNVPVGDGDYFWNCRVVNTEGQEAWAPADFRLTVDANYPDFPVLVAPANGASGVATAPTLQVLVSDPTPGDQLTVQFYGRPTQSSDPDFTLVVLPDTQKYAASYPHIFTAQTSWIRDQVTGANPRNIVFVAHEGDVVDSATTAQYDNAYASMSLLDGVVPYGLLRGNHDTSSTLFNTYFPCTRYQSLPWYGGGYPANANDNSFQTFTVGSQQFLVLHLSFMPDSAVVTWAQGVISSHPNHKVIIVTHAYLDESGNLTNGLDGTSTQYLWDGLVNPYPNVCLVLCGHEHAELTRIDRTTDGRLVPQVLADYQAEANGGNGYLRLMRFSPAQNKVYVQTYSPYLNEYYTDANSEFTLDLPLNPFQHIATVSGQASGSTVSASWPDLAADSSYEWYVKVTDLSGRATQGALWTFTTGNGTPTTPTAYPQSVSTPEDAPTTITLTGYDPAGNPLIYTVVTGPQHGTLSGDAPALLYTPTPNYHGADAFTFTVNGSAPATVSITVIPVNDPPVATPVADLATPEDTALTITLSGTDVDNDPLTSLIVTPPAHGTLAPSGNAWLYTPELNYNGADSFSFQISDGQALSAVESVNLTVTGVNDAPVVSAGEDQTVYTGVTVTLAGSGSDPDSPSLTYEWRQINGPAVTLSGVTSAQATFTAPSVQEQTQLVFELTVSDGTLSATDTVGILVNPTMDIALALQEPIVTLGTLAGLVSATHETGDGTSQTITEVANGSLGRSSLQAEYVLRTTAIQADITGFTLSFVGSWSGLDATDRLVVSIWNGSTWEVITSDLLADGAFVPAANPQAYVSASGDIRVRFTDSAAIKNEKKDTLTVDLLAAVVMAGPPDVQPPDAPTGLSAQASGLNVTLSWIAPADPDVAGYLVYRDGELLNSSSLTAGTTYNDTTPTAGVYTYTVTAVDHAGNESQPSSPLQVTTTQPANTIHVDALTATTVKVGSKYQATATVTLSQPANGAVVTGNWYLKGALIQTGASGTSTLGSVTIASPLRSARSGDVFRFVVTGVTATGFTYVPGDNTVSETSVRVP